MSGNCPTCYGIMVEPNRGISYSGKLCLCNRMNIPNPRTFETQLDLANEMIADKESDCIRLHQEKMDYYMKCIEQEARIKQLEDALRFYAEERNYIKTIYGHPIIQDNGEHANKALSDTAGSEGQGG